MVSENIKILRKFWGETQEELGEAIHVAKNSICNYENGKRDPSIELLSDIASHYMVSVDDLCNGNYSHLKNVSFVTCKEKIKGMQFSNLFLEITSPSAEKNKHFNKGNTYLKEIYKNTERFIDGNGVNIKETSYICNCFEEFKTACNDKDSIIESSINMVGLWIFIGCISIFAPSMYLYNTILNKHIKQLDNNTWKKLMVLEDKEISDSIQLNKCFLNELCTKKEINRLLSIIKESDMYDIAYYFSSLMNICCLNDEQIELTSITSGTNMMMEYSRMGNIYAERYLKLCESSQFVNNK